MLTSSFVRRFKFSVGRDSSILFDLYDKSYAMDLEDFNRIWKIPDGGSINDPSKSSVRDFVSSITVGETRDITQATIGSIHFPALHYFALFIGRCINVKVEHCHLCASDLSILKSAVTGDKSFNMGAIIARRLNKNAIEGDFFGGIYATRIANFLGVPIRAGDPPLHTAFLDRVADTSILHHAFMLIFIASRAVILLVVPYLCLFSLILQGLFEEGEFRQLEFWTGKGANPSPLSCTSPNALKL